MRGLSLGLLLLCGCEAASSESGVRALLRVSGAQFVPGEPAASADDPAVVSLSVLQSAVFPGERGKPLSGTLAEGATAGLLMLEGDCGHFIVVAGPPDVTAPRLPTLSGLLDFSPELPLGTRRLRVYAADAEERIGPPSFQSLEVLPNDSPAEPLLVSLTWDREADLDLHVEDPGGLEIWARKKSGYIAPRPGQPVTPGKSESVGRLDFDSNAACVLDGRRRENVYFSVAPPPGRYRVRVDTFSLCRETTAYFTVAVRLNGALVGQARGQSVAAATAGPHGQGAGLLVLEFMVP